MNTTSTTFEIDPDRLTHGSWSHELNKTLGEGDISASYSADTIGMHGRVRKPFVNQGVLWVCVGRCCHPFECAKACRLIELNRFYGEPMTYTEKTHDGDAARQDPNGFYRGMWVTHGGKHFVLTGRTLCSSPRAPAARIRRRIIL